MGYGWKNTFLLPLFFPNFLIQDSLTMKNLFLLLLSFLCFSAQAQQNLPNQASPNVVLIFMDDMGYGDLEVYGGYPQQTPHLNALAASGMRFTNFYVAQAVCSASRAALLTGCYPNRLNISGALMPWSNTALNPEEETLATLAKKKGYQTGMIGKWHLGAKAPYLPTSYGFDSYFGLPYSNDMWPVGFDGKPVTDTADRKFKYPPLFLLEGNEPVKAIRTLEDQAQLTQLYTQRAVQFIEQHKKRPFFLYLAHSMPHVPIAVSEPYKNKSGAGLFGDLMLELDDSIGEVMAALEKNGLTQNTLVIFTSDNGPWLTFGNHAGSSGGLREGKGSAWEGGVRVPCIMSFPGLIPAGSVSNNLAATMDIFPTLAALLDAPLPNQKIDGVNILQALQHTHSKVAKQALPDRPLFWRDGGLRAVQYKGWKLIHSAKPDKDFLYDLKTDPTEKNNLASTQTEKLKELQALLKSHHQGMAEPLWPTFIEMPIMIDKTLDQHHTKEDEYTYWYN